MLSVVYRSCSACHVTCTIFSTLVQSLLLRLNGWLGTLMRTHRKRISVLRMSSLTLSDQDGYAGPGTTTPCSSALAGLKLLVLLNYESLSSNFSWFITTLDIELPLFHMEFYLLLIPTTLLCSTLTKFTESRPWRWEHRWQIGCHKMDDRFLKLRRTMTTLVESPYGCHKAKFSL